MIALKLTKLYEMQKTLRERIIKEKGLEGQDLFPSDVLALQVEVGEMANNWREFKYWSEDQEPKTWVNTCENCNYGGMKTCCGCEGKLYINPLLSEYVDGLAFVLNLGIQKGYDGDTDYQPYHKINHVGQFNYVFEVVSFFKTFNAKKYYKRLVEAYLGLGEAMEFSWEQIEQAYCDKYKENHKRLDTGY